MEDKTQLPESILLMLEVKAKQTGKSLNEVIEEYKKTIEEGKRQTPYKYVKALTSYKNINKDDLLIFDKNKTELRNKNIYLLQINSRNKVIHLYGEYNQEFDCFILDDKLERVLKRKNNIKILGVLVKVQKETYL